MNGYGRNRFSDGRIFEGEYKNGNPNGVGILTSLKGFKYQGTFVSG